MRRKERAVTDVNDILRFIDEEEIIRLGLIDADGVYIVPVNYGYTFGEDRLVFYFHGASAGRKAEILKNGPVKISFELDGRHERFINEGCESTYYYMSVMGSATASEITDSVAKRAALDSIMSHVGRTDGLFKYGDKVVDATMIVKLTVDSYTAKQNKARS